ncbi:sortase family protein [Lactobacillus selangorensis]|uniref:Sortase family protein n=1 Tax=Lactobacillus selangorensis TaxID=81857 RepID=A0A0R2FZT5_9LACO|nr:sortase family protein [Lactobacillus selangorensis]KRN32987.1 sortase family protein [Lactobacillus selangorensis]
MFSYPFVTQQMSADQQIKQNQTYRKKVKKLSAAQRKNILTAMENYNQTLVGSGQMLTDPYAAEKSQAKQTISKNNKEKATGTLDVMGSELGGSIATIYIPKIKADLPIYDSTSDKALSIGAGLLNHTSYPTGGKGTHAVITAHRGLPKSKLFTDLPKLKKGDKFIIQTVNRTLTYQVDQIKTVKPEDVSQIQIEQDKDLVTLMTCTPYMINTHRLMVRGHRIPNATNKVVRQHEIPWIYVIIGSLLLLGAGYGGVKLYRRQRR